mmetsp:Transcript_7256/g.9480  ORF Transcript_7256/g.9480 Transcript_7256/m.9480 type:complete len:604 (-) Transcript_7256:732-2543(-)
MEHKNKGEGQNQNENFRTSEGAETLASNDTTEARSSDTDAKLKKGSNSDEIEGKKNSSGAEESGVSSDEFDDEIIWEDVNEGETSKYEQDDVLTKLGFVLPSEKSKREIEAEGKEKLKKKRKRQQKALERTRNEHKVHLLVLLAKYLVLNQQSDSSRVKTLAYECIPQKLRNRFTERQMSDDMDKTLLGHVKLLVSWVRANFKVEAHQPINMKSENGNLPSVIKEKRGNDTEVVQLVVSMLRSLNVPTRMVAGLKPRPRKNSDLKRKRHRASNKVPGGVPLEQRTVCQPSLWLEAWLKQPNEHKEGGVELVLGDCKTSKGLDGCRWVHIDPLNDVINDPSWYKSWSSGKGFTRRSNTANEAPYIIAISEFNYVSDITKKYVSRYSQMLRKRINPNSKSAPTQFGEEEYLKLLQRVELRNINIPRRSLPLVEHWWEGLVLGGLRKKAVERSLLLVDQRTKDERETKYIQLVRQLMENSVFLHEYHQLLIDSLEEDMPTSEEGFRKHPRFVLETHLRTDQAISPLVYKKRPSGVFKGVHVYQRVYIVPLRTRNKWKYMARIVKGDELPNPIKEKRIVQKGQRTFSSNEGETTEPGKAHVHKEPGI